jgi:hypothetical protein
MQDVRMVPVVKVSHGFEARVVAARLGSEGIVTQFRGAVEGPYPVGDVEVLVAEADLEVAREILLADEVEASFEDGVDDIAARLALAPWVLLLVVLGVVSFAVVSTMGSSL